jgi:hypothetical protein
MLPLILLLGAVLLLAGCAVGPNAAERFYRAWRLAERRGPLWPPWL